MVKKYIIGVDIGATWLRVALFAVQHFIDKIQERIDVRTRNAISEQIIRLSGLLCTRNKVTLKEIKGVGIASAGPMDYKRGVLINPTNIPFDYVPLTKPLIKRLKVPALLYNDCTAGVMAEKKFGAGKNIDNLVYISLSTGIGGGAIVDGHLLVGKDGNAVEVGHITIDCTEKLKCGCGKWGHWEAYCSGKNIPNYVRMRIKDFDKKVVENSRLLQSLNCLSAELLYQLAKDGDELSSTLVDEIGRLNAIGIANVINAYDPAYITIGGSIILQNKQIVLKHIKKYVKYYSMNRIPKIEVTSLGEDVCLYGAAVPFME